MGGNKDTQLNIIVDAQDKTGTAISSVKGQLDQTKLSIDGVTDAMNRVGKIGAVAFGAAIAVVGTSLSAYSDASASAVVSSQILENSLKSLSEDAFNEVTEGGTTLAQGMTYMTKTMESASEAALQLGFDDEDAAQSFAKLFSVTKDTGEALDELAIAEDLARYKGISLEDATQKLIMVHSGATKELKSLGIAVEEGATVMQNLDSIQKQVAGSAEAYSMTQAGATDMLRNNIENLREAIGGALAPTITHMIETVQPLIEKFALWAQENPKLLETILGIVLVVTGLMAIMLPLSMIMPTIILLVNGLSAAFLFLASGPGIILLAFMATLLLTIGMIRLVIKEMKGDWDYVWLGMQLTVMNVVNSVITAVESMINWIIAGINNVIQLINNLIAKLASIPKIGEMFEGLKIDEIEAVTLAKLDTEGLVSNFNAGQQAAVNNTVNINGGTYLDSDVAETIGDQIIDALQLSTNT